MKHLCAYTSLECSSVQTWGLLGNPILALLIFNSKMSCIAFCETATFQVTFLLSICSFPLQPLSSASDWFRMGSRVYTRMAHVPECVWGDRGWACSTMNFNCLSHGFIQSPGNLTIFYIGFWEFQVCWGFSVVWCSSSAPPLVNFLKYKFFHLVINED